MYIRRHSEGVSPQIYSLVTTRAISLTISPLVIAYTRTLQVSNSFSLHLNKSILPPKAAKLSGFLFVCRGFVCVFDLRLKRPC